MPEEWTKDLPKGVMSVAAAVALLAAGAAGWASLGFPVPMTVDMYHQFEAHAEDIRRAETALEYAEKVLNRQTEGTPEYDEALAFHNEAQERLDALREG